MDTSRLLSEWSLSVQRLSSASVLALAALSLVGCGDSLSGPTPPAGEGELVFKVDVSRIDVSRVDVEVSAADLDAAIIRRLELTGDGMASGAIMVPEGLDRHVLVRGYDLEPGERFTVRLVAAYRNELTTDVLEGSRQILSMELAASNEDGASRSRQRPGSTELEAG